jgi:hypothetical protein
MADYTNFCCRSGGSNLNAGTVDGSTAVPATTPLVAYTGGDWTSGTDVYIAPVGADMTEAQVGRFAALFHDGDSAPVANQYLVARITNVNAGTRSITLSTTNRAQLGSEVASGTGTRSLRIGGAWAGPAVANGFPFTLTTAMNTLQNAAGNPTRVNLRNDQTYSITANFTIANGSAGITIRGFTAAYGDGGRATIAGPTTGSAFTLVSIPGTSTSVNFEELEFKDNGASGGSGSYGLSLQTGAHNVWRCVFRDLRGPGLHHTTPISVSECEFYGCNQSNTASQGAVQNAGGSLFMRRSVIHDNAGANTAGVFANPSNALVVIEDCVIESNGGRGISSSNSPMFQLTRTDVYNNGSDGVFLASGAQLFADSCNFVKNGGWAVNASASCYVRTLNCGFGSGTQANAAGNLNLPASVAAVESGTVTYAADVTPWADPASGDFRVALEAAKGAGRGTFLQTAAGYAGTVGYPDIGAAQSQAEAGGGVSGSRIFGGF